MYSGLDYIKVLENFQKAASLVRGPELSYVLMLILQTYILCGFPDQAEALITDYVNLTQDSLVYCMANNWLNLVEENTEDRNYWLSRAYAYDTTNPIILDNLAESYISIGKFEEGLKYYKESLDIYGALDRIITNRLHRIGYAFERAGFSEEADYYLNKAEDICISIINLNRPSAQYGTAPYDLSLIYAFRGEKSKAMEILGELQQRTITPFIPAWIIQSDPMLDGIRDDPEFQQIANDLGKKYAAEAERVRQWLEANEML